MEKCLQDKTGSCAGCNICEIIRAKGTRLIENETIVLTNGGLKIQAELCPENRRVQIGALTPSKQSIW